MELTPRTCNGPADTSCCTNMFLAVVKKLECRACIQFLSSFEIYSAVTKSGIITVDDDEMLILILSLFLVPLSVGVPFEYIFQPSVKHLFILLQFKLCVL